MPNSGGNITVVTLCACFKYSTIQSAWELVSGVPPVILHFIK